MFGHESLHPFPRRARESHGATTQCCHPLKRGSVKLDSRNATLLCPPQTPLARGRRRRGGRGRAIALGSGLRGQLSWVALVFMCLVWPGWSAGGEKTATENPLLATLMRQGVRFPEDLTVKLPPPELADGLEESQQRRIVRQLAQRYGWDQFVRASTVAPFMLRQAYVKDKQGVRVGHAVDLWFVAHGPLEIFGEPGRAKEVFGNAWAGGNASDVALKELDDQEMLAHGVEEIDEAAEKYALVAFSLMNRVYVQGMGHVRRSRTDESVIVAWELDPRFHEDNRRTSREVEARSDCQSDDGGAGPRSGPLATKDAIASLCNCWRPIETTELGRRTRGDARPYRGYGGYLKITKLLAPNGALLFEAHVVFHEPEDWFRGSNFLRSKIPLLVKEGINRLRRKLALR